MEDGLVVIGIDAHKRTHTMVATDAVSRRLAETTVEATADGHLGALRVGGPLAGALVGGRRTAAT